MGRCCARVGRCVAVDQSGETQGRDGTGHFNFLRGDAIHFQCFNAYHALSLEPDHPARRRCLQLGPFRFEEPVEPADLVGRSMEVSRVATYARRPGGEHRRVVPLRQDQSAARRGVGIEFYSPKASGTHAA